MHSLRRRGCWRRACVCGGEGADLEAEARAELDEEGDGAAVGARAEYEGAWMVKRSENGDLGGL